jgi:hypothetical protein
MIVMRTAVFSITMLILGTNAFCSDSSPSDILKKVADTYKTMKTYKVEGILTKNIEHKKGGSIRKAAEYSFSILLKKPNLYLITWTQTNAPSDKVRSYAVWSDGTQPYLYTSFPNHRYCKLASDEIAINYVEDMRSSFNINSKVPSLFLQLFKEYDAPFFWLRDEKLEKDEKIGEEDCYVISGTSATSKRVTIWVSKTSYLVRKYYFLTDLLKILNQKAEITSKLKKLFEEDIKSRTTTDSYTEVHAEISSPELNKDDFKFVLPEGSVLRDEVCSWLEK